MRFKGVVGVKFFSVFLTHVARERMNFRRGGGMNRRVSRIETESSGDVVSHLRLDSFRRSSIVNQVDTPSGQ